MRTSGNCGKNQGQRADPASGEPLGEPPRDVVMVGGTVQCPRGQKIRDFQEGSMKCHIKGRGQRFRRD